MHLKPVPNSPCGVSSYSNAPQSRISAIRPHEGKASNLKRLAKIISRLHGCQVLTLREDYIYASCKRCFVFTDELELLWSESEKVIHVRSVAKSGFTDFGANRARLHYIQQQFDKGSLF